MIQKIPTFVLVIMMCHGLKFSYGQSRGPNTFKYEFCLKQVSYGGSLNSNYIKIKKDDSSGDFLPPHYINGTCSNSSNEVKPVAYVAGTQPRVTAILDMDCTGGPLWISAKVECSNTDVPIHYYPAVNISTASGSNEYIYKSGLLDYVSAVDATGAVFTFGINKTLYIEEYKVQWRIAPNSTESPSLIDENLWEIVGESNNTIYVTYSLPILSLANGHEEETKPLHTLLHIGCKNADKSINPSEVVNNIYNEFKDNKVYRIDNAGPIKYWGFINPLTPQPACWQPSQMLINLDGRCGGWAAFFEDIIRLQGIATSNNSEVRPNSDFYNNLKSDAITFFGDDIQYINFTPIQGDIQNHPQFYVNKWNIDPSHKFFIDEFWNQFYNLSITSFIVN